MAQSLSGPATAVDEPPKPPQPPAPQKIRRDRFLLLAMLPGLALLLTFHYLGSASRTEVAKAALPVNRAAEHSAAD